MASYQVHPGSEASLALLWVGSQGVLDMNPHGSPGALPLASDLAGVIAGSAREAAS